LASVFNTIVDDDTSSSNQYALYSEYFYPQVSAKTISNVMPVTNDPSPLIQRIEYPRVTFTFSNFRDETGTTVPATDLDIFINSDNFAGSPASNCYGGSSIRSGSPLPCLESSGIGGSAAFSNSTIVQCSIDVCDLSCSDVYFGVARNQATNTRYTYDVSVVNNYNDLVNSGEVQFLDLTLSSGTVSVGRSNLTTPDINTVVYVRVRSSNINAGQFTQYSVSPTGSNTRILVQTVSGLTDKVCGGSLASLCDIDASQTCVWQSDPCEASYDAKDPEYISYFRVTRSAGTGSWGFNFVANTITISPLDSASTSLSSTNPTYSAVKEIDDFSWHFYEFSIATNDGYSYLDLQVTNLRCARAASAPLSVYSTFGDMDDDDEWADINILNQWPSAECNLDQGTTTDFTSHAMDTCEFNAGIYRLSVFADEDTQLFPNPSVLVAPVPALYEIQATLSTVPHIVMDGCSLTQDSASFVNRIEVRIPATNRGSELQFTVEYDGVGSVDATFSGLSFPYGRLSGQDCQFSAAAPIGDNVRTCSATSVTPCVIDWEPCAFSDGTFYVFVTSPSSGSVTISYSLLAPYIPVIDAVAQSGSPLSYQIATDADHFQMFRIDSTSDFIFEVSSPYCSTCDADVRMYNYFRTHAYDSDGSASSNRDCRTCDDEDYSCNFDGSNSCSNVVSMCDIGVSSIFFSIENDDDTYDCTYEIVITATESLTPLVLQPNVNECLAPSAKHQLYVINNIGSTEELSLSFDDIEGRISSSYTIRIGASPDCLPFEAASSSFTLTRCDVAYTNQVYILVSFEDVSCVDNNELLSISYSVDSYSVQTASIGSNTLSSDFLSITPSSFLAVNGVSGTQSNVFASSPCGSPSCLSVLAPSTTYYFSSDVSLSSLNIQSLSTSAVSGTLNSPTEQLVYSLPGSSSAYTIYIEDIAYSPLDFAEVTDISFRIASSSGSPTNLFGCSPCSAGQVVNGCGDNSLPATITFDDCDITDNAFVTVSLCGESFTCPVSFTIRIVPAGLSIQSISGGTHNSAYTTFTSLSSGCNAATSTAKYTFSSSDILMVSVRQPMPTAGGAEQSADVSLVSCGDSYNCLDVNNMEAGRFSTCAMPLPDSCSENLVNCVGTNDWTLTVALSAPGSVEFQVITDYVALTSAVSNVIRGQTAHFYRLDDAASALSIELTVSNGPFIEFTVHDGCDGDGYYEKQPCYFGTCTTYLPTVAKHPGSSELYIILASSSLTSEFTFFNPNENTNMIKQTSYSLNVVKSVANCASPPSSGFCADSSRAGVNVWAEVSNSVWAFDDPLSQDSVAECLYNDLVDRCVAPSVECKQWLKTFACVTKFPQCDSNGFQMGVCQDLCLQVESVCGPFINAKSGDNQIPGDGEDVRHLFEFYQCNSNQYVRGSNGTCYDSLPVTEPVVVVDPLSFFNDDDNDGPGEYGLPFYLDVPIFDTIYATIPPIVNDDDDGIGLKEQTFSQQLDNNSSAVLSSYFVFALLLITLLI